MILTLFLFAILGTTFQVQAQMPGQGIIGFYANLSANEEVPPTQSNATGLAVFLFSNETSELSYLVNATGLELEEITESLIYNGSAGSNGESVASLSDESTNEESNSSIMFQGEIKEDNLQGMIQGKEIKDLVTLMSNGSAYANIHTNQYKDGEIRGQIVLGEVQMNGDAITGLAVPGGLVGLSGISLKGGAISFSLGGGGGIIGFVPIFLPGGGVQGPGGVGGVVTEGGTIGGETVSTLGGIVGGTVKSVGETAKSTTDSVGGTVKSVGETAKSTTDSVDNTVNKIDEGIVKRILDHDDDDDDSRDSDDDDDSRDSDDDEKDSDDDEKDSDDDEKDDGGDSVTDKVKDLLD